MAPLKTQVSCPNCRAPVAVSLEQVFDVAQDPSAKNRLISGRFNVINCPSCRFQGQAATPLLYHDPDKELLLTYVPMELGLPQAEQEKVIGRMMNEVINKLPQEKRKGYLLNPKPALTVQGLIERVLEGEGVTKEMLEAQRAKSQLVQKFLTASDEALPQLAKEHDGEIDYTFFQLLALSAEAAAASGNQAGATRMAALRDRLLDLSSFGAQAKKQQQAFEDTARELQGLGDKLTQDKLLELIIRADDEERVMAYASLARPALDYAFFEALTRRIDKAQSPEKERLTQRRDLLLQITQEIDETAKAQMAEATHTLRAILAASDVNQAVMENLPRLDDTFMAVLNANLEAAQKAGRQDVVQRLSQVNAAIMQAMQSAAPPEIRFINELLQIESDDEAAAALKRRSAEINQGLVDAMTYLGESLRQSQQPAIADRLDKLRAIAIEQLMAANWKK